MRGVKRAGMPPIRLPVQRLPTMKGATLPQWGGKGENLASFSAV